MWLWGGMFYIWMISLIFYRYTFFAFSPGDLSPPYWINMGAMAISVLVGARLTQNTEARRSCSRCCPSSRASPSSTGRPGPGGFRCCCCSGSGGTSTGASRCATTHPYWGAVFPLGMYTVCTLQMAKALNLDFLLFIPRYFIFVAALAWCLAFVGLLHHLGSRLLFKQHSPAETIA